MAQWGFLWPFKKPELTLSAGSDSQSKHSISSLSDVSKQAYAILIMFKWQWKLHFLIVFL